MRNLRSIRIWNRGEIRNYLGMGDIGKIQKLKIGKSGKKGNVGEMGIKVE